MYSFTIKVPPRTKKNHQEIGYRYVLKGKRRVKIPFIRPGKAYREYEKDCEDYVPELHIDYPVNIKAIYYTDIDYSKSKRKIDLCNLHEALCDVLVHCGCIEDDNCRIIVSMDGSRVKHDDLAPRTEVFIERVIV